MGGALLKHWNTGNENFTVADPFLDSAPRNVRLVKDISSISGEKFDVIIVAIKPQMIDEVLPAYRPLLVAGGYVLSIAAGASLARLASAMGSAPIIRVMPNLPAAVGKATSGLCPSQNTDSDQLAHARDLMERAGVVVSVKDEDMLDRITAVAGSGPGYVFEIARAYISAAREMGFDEEQARQLVLGTMEGTVAMALVHPDISLEDLRNSVTSKGGTTAAGLEALNGDGTLSRKLRETVEAAYRRAVELR